MNIPYTIENGICVISPTGELTSKTIDEFREFLNLVLENATIRALCINFENVQLIDSVALGALASRSLRMEARGTAFFICSLNKMFQELFQITNLDRRINIFSTPLEGIQSLQG